MASDSLTNFYFKFKKQVKNSKILPNYDLFSLFKSTFPVSDTDKLTKDSVYFNVKHPKANVQYRIESLSEIHPESVVAVKIDYERLPISSISGELPKIVDPSPQNHECTVKIRGLPWECGSDEIVKFFEGLQVKPNGVFLEGDPSSNRKHNGDAYVEFISPESVPIALEKNKVVLFGRYIEVHNTTKEEIMGFKRKNYEERRFRPQKVPADENSIILKLLGLPWNTIYSDIYKLMPDVPLTAIHFAHDNSGRPNGVAFIEVADEEFCARALGHHREFIGKRFVDIKRSTIGKLNTEVGRQVQIANKTYCVFIKNLQPALTNYEIESFFSKSQIMPFRIHKKVNGTEAYVEFLSQKDFFRALSKNGCVLAGNSLVVNTVSYDEVVRKVGLHTQ